METPLQSTATPAEHVYLRRLARCRQRGQLPGGVGQVSVAHDSYCGIYSGAFCNCDPHIQMISGGAVYTIDRRGRAHKVGKVG